jgi:hypothetical protein
LQHFVASAIATGDIDSRDWMKPDEPWSLADRVVKQLGGTPGGTTVVEALGRDLWVDFIADTGDDVAVSEAVGRLFARPYEVPDPERPGEFLVAPRGDMMLHGGDVAYPVATTLEIHDRFVVPFNRALVEQRDDTYRALLGIPGNHDWYAGLDGFGRLFRRRVGELRQVDEQASVTLDRNAVALAVDWVESFVAGKSVSQRRALVLDGYVPVQDASYFVLPLTPHIHLFGVDRQLRTVDFRQRTYFTQWRKDHPDVALWVTMPDPYLAYLEPNPAGVGMVEALELRLGDEPHLVLCGDTHQYSRSERGPTVHVTAGGGGAFLHGARIDRKGLIPPIAEWPGPKASRALLSLVPWHVAAGRAGLLPHFVMLLLFAPALGVGLGIYHSDASVEGASAVAAMIGTATCALIGGWRRGRFVRISILASLTGLVMGLAPTLSTLAFALAIERVGRHVSPNVHGALVLILAVFFGALAFGAYLCALTITGLETSQAHTALGHPSHKHFVRLRVRAAGDAIDAWVIGLHDPLCPGEKPVLVDAFTWRPARRN